jgi:hypothetical protein
MTTKRLSYGFITLAVLLWGFTGITRADHQPDQAYPATWQGAATNAVILQNDSYTTGDTAGFLGGFLIGEISASRLTPPGPERVQITSIRLLFGGANSPSEITLHIWDDSASATNPGILLFSGQYALNPHDTVPQEIDLTPMYIFVEDTFRVGVEYTWNGLPSTGFDTDGIVPGVNFLYINGFWYPASTFGPSGDWIIRAVVQPLYHVTYLPLMVK